jgi:uncharacterized protein YndB with AHSA1/START domain
MGIVLFAMGTVVAIIISMLVGGLMLPARHSTTRALLLTASPDVVWSLVADPAGYAAWRDGVTSVDVEGRAPLRWREFGDDGALAFEASAVQAPQTFRAHTLDDDVARRTERDFHLAPQDGGTRLVYTEHMTVANPIARFVYRYIMRRHGAIDALLGDLARALGERATPMDADARTAPDGQSRASR